MEDRKFTDISYISHKQYNQYKNWVDMVTVMGNVNDEVLEGMSGVVLVNDMSNNTFNYTDNVSSKIIEYSKNIIGVVSQSRFPNQMVYTMTPGIGKSNSNVSDQQYRTRDTVDADIYIIGRGLYVGNPEENILEYM